MAVAKGQIGDTVVDTGAKPSPTGLDIRLEGLTKQFNRIGGERVNAIDGMDLHIAAGEFLVLVGPSGCGKTTLLRCLAGLESPDTGVIRFGDTAVFSSSDRRDAAPEKRDAAMLFQSYALWPHMTVFDNVAYPLKSKKIPQHDIQARVTAILDKVQCGNLASQYPGQISGGQQQRIALARALVAGNRIVLFDEPLSNIDAKVRDQLRWEIQRIQREIGFTAIYVTHDQVEALTLADKIAVLKEGAIAQLGSPHEVYNEPASAYVARFMGTLNELRGVPAAASGRSQSHAVYDTDIGPLSVHCRPAPLGSDDNAPFILGFRPSACTLYDEQRAPDTIENVFPANVIAETFLGTHYEYIVRVQDSEFRCLSQLRLHPDGERNAKIQIPAHCIRLLRD